VLYAGTRKPGLVGDDAGLVINPDGARNQLEGGIIHAASMTLKEPVTLDGDGIASLDWNRYPIPRFS
jgi:nicotinate dehydrogenase subunit B